MKKFCYIFLLIILNLIFSVKSYSDIILSEGFEGTLDPRISFGLKGTFTDLPGIKNTTIFGSTKAYGFGRSTCPANCFWNYVDTLKITFATPTYIQDIQFKDAELYGNWGSEGYIYLDGVDLGGGYAFSKIPPNDHIADITFRNHTYNVNKVVQEICFINIDITTESEVFIDDILITGGSPQIASTNQIDFGRIVCENQKDFSIWVKNSGTGDLTINSASFQGTNSSNFSLISPNIPDIISQNDSVLYNVRFQAITPGNYSAQLVLHNNTNSVDSVWGINLTAIKDSINFILTTDTLNFGILCPNVAINDSVNITNVSSISTRFFRSNVNLPFELVNPDPIATQFGINESRNINFHFRGSKDTGIFISNFTITDSCNRIKRLILKAEVRKPFANAGADQTICSRDSVLIGMPSSAGLPPYTYNWTPPDFLSNPNIAQPIIKPVNNGSSKLTLKYKVRVTDQRGCFDEDSIIITVNPSPDVKILASGNTTLCKGDSVLLTASPSGANYSYNWSNGSNSQFIYAKESGQYIATVTNTITGCKDTASVYINVNPAPSSAITVKGNTMICPGDSTILSATGSIDYTYKWSTGENTQNITVKKAGIYSVTVTNDYGCSSTDSVEIKIIPPLSLTMDKTGIDFGDLDPCSSKKIDSINILNTGSEDATIVQVISTDNAFSLVSPIPQFIIPNGNSILVKISFSSSIANIHTGKIQLVSVCGDTFSFNVTGRKLHPFVSSDSISNIDFGQSCIENSVTIDTVITIYNKGTADAVFQVPVVSTPPFSVINPKFPLTLKAGDSIKVTIRYIAGAEGFFNLSAMFPYKIGTCPDDTIPIDLNAIRYRSELTTSTPLINMPDMCECEIAKDTTITIFNTGNAPDTLWEVVTDLNSKYVKPSPLPIIIQPGDSVQLTLQFTPISIDTVTSIIKLYFNPCDKSISITMTGRKNGVGFVPPDTIKFGEFVLCRDSSMNQNLTVTNKNCNSELGRITNVIINSPAFQSDIHVNDTLPYNGTKTYNITYKPTSSSDTSAILEIHYEPCSIIKKIVLTGKATNPALIASNVDFGITFQNQISTGELTLKNTGTTIDTVTDLSGIKTPFSFVPPTPTFPIILNPGDSVKIKISYSPQTRNIDTCVLTATIEPCNIVSTCKLFGNSTSYATTVVYIDSANVNAGENVILHLNLKHSENLTQSGITGFQARFGFNKTMLYPKFKPDKDSIIDNERIIEVSGTVPNGFTQGILKDLPFIAALGDSECTVMRIDTVIWQGGPYEVVQENGQFCLNNVCQKGKGPRLFEDNGTVSLMICKPNPVSGSGEIDFEVIEEAYTTLYLYDILGNKVKVLYEGITEAGKYTVYFSTNDLTQGMYLYILQTPTLILSNKLGVIK